MKPDPTLTDEGPLCEYCTADILHDYKMLIQDFGHDDNLVTEMRGILVDRHRYLVGDEAGNVGQDWHGAHCDTSAYHVSANLIFEVDKALYEYYESYIDGPLRQRVPIDKDNSSAKCQYLIGFQMSCEDILMGHLDTKVAKKIVDAALRTVKQWNCLSASCQQ